MMKWRILTALIACFTLIAYAAELPEAKLPVRRVVLYKNGVGYFEHTGRVHGDQDLQINFTSSQLNDVLKSLTVLDLNGGKISGVGYNSVAPISEQMKSLRLPLNQAANLQSFLSALRGARVQVRNGSALFSGRLLSVEEKTSKHGQDEIKSLELSVITDAGEVRTFPLSAALSVRVADHDLSEEISRYLTLVGSARDQDTRRMTISTSGNGDRNLFVSYISEVPVWKSTYRILLPTKSDSRPLLQGWAIVDNTVNEDWTNVELSLVAGAPQSFIQDLSKPYYTRRPVVDLPEAAMLTPQTHEGTLDTGTGSAVDLTTTSRSGTGVGYGGGVAGGSAGGVIGGVISNLKAGPGISGQVTDPSGAAVGNARLTATNTATGDVLNAYSDSNGNFHLPAPAGSYRIEAQSPGFNTASQNVQIANGESRWLNYRLTVGASTETVEVTSAPSAAEKRLNLESAANNDDLNAASEDLGDLFEYNLKEKVTILKNHSALVPIINSHVEAEKVTLWNGSSARPLRALWITNTSGLTLDRGSFNIIENNAFAGEGLIEALKPAEKRILSYAVDQGVRVEEHNAVELRPVTHIKIAKGVMVQTSERRDHEVYTIRNSDADAREVIIEHPVRPEWKLAQDLKPEEKSASFYRFRVKVKPNETATLRVDEVQPLLNTIALSSMTDQQVKIFFDGKTANPELEQALRRILQQKDQIAAVDSQIHSRRTTLEAIAQDQQRLRENMKALKGSAEEKTLLQRYTRELNNQEDKLQDVRAEIARLELQREEKRQQLDASLEAMTMDTEI